MSGPQRKCAAYTLAQTVSFSIYDIGVDVALNSVTFGVDLFGKKPDKITIDCPELEASVKQQFLGHVFTVGQEIPMDFGGLKLMCHVESFEHASIDGSASSESGHLGQVIAPSACNFHKASGSSNNLLFTGGVGPARNDNLFKAEFDFEKMGIGGLGKEFNTILRKAFAPRIYPGLVKQLGINFIRGMLLYGAPGCGKTLIARQIGKVLNARYYPYYC
jgi:vesicle-fusing ATPase